ncbi:MAG TPA: PAS domain-containing protein [Ktedonobacterales bacterium]
MKPGTPSHPDDHMERHEPSDLAPASGSAANAALWLDLATQANGSVWWLTDNDGLLVDGARGLSKSTGAPESSLMGSGWLSALASSDRATIERQWQAAKSLPAPLHAAGRFVLPDGSYEWRSVRASPAPPTPDGHMRWLWIATQTAHERAVLSIDHYRMLFEQSAEGLLLIGVHGRPVRANQRALQLLGLSLAQARNEATPPTGWRIMRTDGSVVDEPFREITAATSEGRAAHYFWRVTSDGWPHEHWLSINCSPIISSQIARRKRTLVYITDVTKQAQAHFDIQTTAEKSSGDLAALHAALDRMTDSFVVLDFEGRFVYLNARAREQFGNDGEELLGKRFWEAFPNLAGAEPHIEFERMLRVPTPNILETQMVSGEWYEFRAYPAADGISVYIRDITEQKLTMDALDAALLGEQDAHAEAEARAQQLAAIFEAVGDGMVVFARDGAVLRSNSAMSNLLGIFGSDAARPASAEAFTALFRRFAAPNTDGAPMAAAPPQRILAGESLIDGQTVDLHLRTPSGRNVYFNASGAPIRGADGGVLGAVMSLRDVSAEREAEQERNRTLSLVAHELRTPLTAIKLSLDLMARRIQRNLELDPAAFDVALASCTQLERMAADLVDAARAERNKMDVTPVACDVRDLAAQAVAEQGTVSDATIIYEPPTEAMPVNADPVRIHQVFSNLLSNAVKYSPHGATIQVQVEARDGSVWCGVSDEGQGVSPEAIPHLFDAFYRAQEGGKRSSPHVGLGLGLFLCKRIVELHGGQIGMQPRPTQGSLFWFTLPLVQVASAS